MIPPAEEQHCSFHWLGGCRAAVERKARKSVPVGGRRLRAPDYELPAPQHTLVCTRSASAPHPGTCPRPGAEQQRPRPARRPRHRLSEPVPASEETPVRAVPPPTPQHLRLPARPTLAAPAPRPSRPAPLPPARSRLWEPHLGRRSKAALPSGLRPAHRPHSELRRRLRASGTEAASGTARGARAERSRETAPPGRAGRSGLAAAAAAAAGLAPRPGSACAVQPGLTLQPATTRPR
ncbi:uncharacterized protein LOC144579690 [Callithrix jacchus]